MNKDHWISNALFVFAAKYNWVFWVVVLVIGGVKGCSVNQDPIDMGARVSSILKIKSITDSNGDGFVLYFRNDPAMTEGRINQLKSSPNMMGFIDKLDSLENAITKPLLLTDPYEIVDIVESIGVPDSVVLSLIEGTGEGKVDLYRRPNPHDSSMVSSPPFLNTDQGVVYLTEEDMRKFSVRSKIRHYRYRNANFGMAVVSDTDQQYSHMHRYEVPNH